MKNFIDRLPDLGYLGLGRAKYFFFQLSPAALVEEALKRNEGVLAENGALVVDTGEFTGRSPKDRFIVLDSSTYNTVHWSDVNIKFDSDKFDALYDKVTEYLSQRN
ncbi:MAG: phosphoenolpyruvate carboxykinase (ATP), partial [Mucilaginibacter sp.]